MPHSRQVRSALISVFHKEGLKPIIEALARLNIAIYSTGGTASFIRGLGVEVHEVGELTSYPSILGGRVKTLHPKVFGGILARRDDAQDLAQLKELGIPQFDLVIVDLYPFEETVKNAADEQAIIEKIDIGGISLIRAAAKNFKDTLVVPSRRQYRALLELLENKKGETELAERKLFAARAFNISSHYDTAIFNYFNAGQSVPAFKQSLLQKRKLCYGENPHQEGAFYGQLDDLFEQHHGKELSYNNLVDIDAAVNLIDEFGDTTVAILKHTNSCGLASRNQLKEAWQAALAGDPVSAFGGIVIANRPVDVATATEVNQIFIEVIIAPAFEKGALDILKSKKNRIILTRKESPLQDKNFKSLLNGVIVQDKDLSTETSADFAYPTKKRPEAEQVGDLVFANKAVKHLKSNGIALVKDRQLIGIGTGQTSRVDALNQSILKARQFELDLKGAVMASDAFFPFPDCVEIAGKAGITAVIQPGGSVRDQESVDYCNENGLAMVFTGHRHFKH